MSTVTEFVGREYKTSSQCKIERIVGREYRHTLDDSYHFVIKYGDELWLIKGENIYNLIAVLQKLATRIEAN